MDNYKLLYDFLSPTDDAINADLIIGFGHFDMRIPEQCAVLFNKNFASRILFTGGVGAGSGDFNNPEAIEFQNYLKQNYPKIKPKNVLIEEESTNTGENIKKTITLLKEKGIFDSIRRVILVATPSRQLRVYLTAKKLLPNIELVNIPPVSSFEYDLKIHHEKGIDFKKYLLGELHRIKIYPKLGFNCSIAIPQELEDFYNVLYKE